MYDDNKGPYYFFQLTFFKIIILELFHRIF